MAIAARSSFCLWRFPQRYCVWSATNRDDSNSGGAGKKFTMLGNSALVRYGLPFYSSPPARTVIVPQNKRMAVDIHLLF